jgi:hypothetical protein
MRTTSVTAIIGAVASLVAVNAHAALISSDGGLGVYDATNNVTWTSDANLMATQAASYSGGPAAFVTAVIADSGGVIHDTPSNFNPSGTYTLSASDFSTSSGSMDWWGAQGWVHYLDVTNYGGANQWALPTTVDSSASIGYPNGAAGNPSQSSSQLAQLFYGGLGQVQGSHITTTHNTSYALFSNVQDTVWWSGTQSSVLPNSAWSLDTINGYQFAPFKTNFINALAVSPGQVSAVPLPAAAWLMLSGLSGLGVLARKKRAA